jgi:YD repeat-containing protein
MNRKFAQARVAAIVCAVAMVGFGSAVHAQVTIPQEYGKTIKTAEVVGTLGNDLFGDQVNLYTGSTSFSVTDVSLAGNDGLPVRVGRRYVVEDRGDDKQPGLFADWELDIPSLSGTFARNKGWQTIDGARPNARCSVGGLHLAVPPDASGNQGGLFAAEEYWNGHTLHVPGQGDMEMLVDIAGNPDRPTDGATYYWTTSERWFFSCLPTIHNGSGEGFLARAPDGTRYWFDWMVKRTAKTLKKEGEGPVGFAVGSGSALLSREEIRLLPTKMQDRFGNTVTYAYNATNPWRLERIASPDGRTLTLTYNTAGRIASVSDGTRTWTYTYDADGLLSEVRLPDASKWTYDLKAVGDAIVAARVPATCDWAPSADAQSTYTGSITHPSGAVGTFVFRPTLQGRSYVTRNCIGPAPHTNTSWVRHAYLFDTIAL